MTDPQIAIMMLGLFILTILLGFPICFTLVAMAFFFGYYAYATPDQWDHILDNRIFDLLVNQTYSVMINDVLVAVPLFLFIGYVVERANIVDRLFFSLNIAARAIPGSLAVAALLTCAMFATAVGIIGAVVTLMGLLAFPVMLKAGYDESFSAGVICAGGCLGILIPPSIMLIVYAAASGVSVVKLYAGAMLPGMLLAGLYMIYVMGRAYLNPSLAPKPSKEETDIPLRDLLYMLLTSFMPLALLILSVLGAILFGLATPTEAASVGALAALVLASGYRLGAILEGSVTPAWVGNPGHARNDWLEAVGVGSLVVFLLYFGYYGLRLLADAWFGVAMPEERHLPGGPGLSVVIGLAAAGGFRYFAGPVPLLAWLRPKTVPGHALMESAGIGALAGLGLGALYMVGVQFLGLGAYLYEEETTNWALDVGFYVGMLGFIGWRPGPRDRSAAEWDDIVGHLQPGLPVRGNTDFAEGDWIKVTKAEFDRHVAELRARAAR